MPYIIDVDNSFLRKGQGDRKGTPSTILCYPFFSTFVYSRSVPYPYGRSIGTALWKSSSKLVGARVVKGGWVGLYGRPGVVGKLTVHRKAEVSRRPASGDHKGIDSNIFVQESRRGSPKGGCNGAHPLVILSVSEGSRCPAREILR